MSAYSFPKINQKEYLKKYLSGDKVKKKKKDKKSKKSSTATVKVKIIDDDINLLDTVQDIDEELLLTGDDAPQIVAEYIEDKPENRNIPKWKSIVVKDEPEDERGDSLKENEAERSSQKSNEIKLRKEVSMSVKGKKKLPTSSIPPRSHHKSSTHTKLGRDKSPARYGKNEDLNSCLTKIKKEPQSPADEKLDHNSLLRKNKRQPSFDLSPSRMRRNSDQSPPRRVKRSDELLSPARRESYDQSTSRKARSPRNDKNYYNQTQIHRRRDSDQSPPRRLKSEDQSPPRRRRNNSKSPERRKSSSRNDRKDSPIQSPIRRKQRRDSDQSPPRKGKRRNSDQVSPRIFRNSSNRSPPRKSAKSLHHLPLRRRRSSDQSPPRRTRSSPPKLKKRSPDPSSPRRRRKSPTGTHNNSPETRIKHEGRTPQLSPQPRSSKWRKQEMEKSLSPPPTHKPRPGKTLEGKKAGLQDAKALQEETVERGRQEDLLFKKMPSDVTGRYAEVQVRSTGRKGRRAKQASAEDLEERRRKEEDEEKKKFIYDCWGKGLKQIEDYKNRKLEEAYESSKPLARYSNDEDLERHLKEQERIGDPMLEYMRQKRKEKEKQSGKPQIPRYEGPYPENRFGIPPGHRWDGVDRSNGYEKRYLNMLNEKKARQEEAYKYSVEDM